MELIVPNKNFALRIDAFADAAVPGRRIILGEGPERDVLERQIAARDLGDRVLFPGFLENPFPLIAGADCYILPSNAKGFHNGLVEAMALGLPVLSTGCPAVPPETLAAQTGRAACRERVCQYGGVPEGSASVRKKKI